MKVEVKNLKGETVNTIELPAEIFEAPVRPDLMHQALVRQMANARQGTHSTKTRGEVAGGGKPWKQKGTGRARQGSTRSPIFNRGGKAHTPKPRDYSVSMPKQMRRAALRSALSAKAAASAVVVVDVLAFDAPKTKLMAQALGLLCGANKKALVLLPSANENVEKSVRNLASAKYLRANYLNVKDLLGADTVVLPVAVLDVLASYLG